MAHLRVAIAAALAVTLSACSRGSGELARGGADAASYQISVFPAPGQLVDFSGNYIRVVGVRDGIADLKYPCVSFFDVCLPIQPDGTVEPVVDLCPTTDALEPGQAGTGTWTFSYQMFSDAACLSPLANIDCPQTLNEPIDVGRTTNNVRCTTANGTKTINVCIYDPVTGVGEGTNCPPAPPTQYVCADDRDCAHLDTTYVCIAGTCVDATTIACTGDPDCPAGYVCDTLVGLCAPAP